MPVDFALHDTYWVVAHLHYVLFGGSVFGIIGGLLLLVPQDDRPDAERDASARSSSWLHVHRLQPDLLPDARARAWPGMPRRIADYSSTAGWNDLNLLATIGGFTIAASMLLFLWNVFLSLRSGEPAGDDPWEGNTLEWATTLAAARLQLRPPARDPLGATGLRPPARPDGRALSGPRRWR